MFELKISAGNNRTTVTAEVTDTIAKALRDNDLSTQGALVAVNGHILQMDQLDNTFDQLGVRTGGTAILSVTVKADSAM